MKKHLLILTAALTSFTAFAQEDFSLKAGAGGILTANLGGGIIYDNATAAISMENMGFGGFAFFDMTYAELYAAFTTGYSTIKIINVNDNTGLFSALNFGLLLKYPFSAGLVFLYPLAGADYQIFLSQGDRKGKGASDEVSDLNSLWFRFGFGADFLLSDNLFIRAEAVYGIRLINKYEEDLEKEARRNGASLPEIQIGHGPIIKIGVGWIFE